MLNRLNLKTVRNLFPNFPLVLGATLTLSSFTTLPAFGMARGYHIEPIVRITPENTELSCHSEAKTSPKILDLMRQFALRETKLNQNKRPVDEREIIRLLEQYNNLYQSRDKIIPNYNQYREQEDLAIESYFSIRNQLKTLIKGNLGFYLDYRENEVYFVLDIFNGSNKPKNYKISKNNITDLKLIGIPESLIVEIKSYITLRINVNDRSNVFNDESYSKRSKILKIDRELKELQRQINDLRGQLWANRSNSSFIFNYSVAYERARICN
jgi:hypothetical protein